jgi:hypothetical protein
MSGQVSVRGSGPQYGFYPWTRLRGGFFDQVARIVGLTVRTFIRTIPTARSLRHIASMVIGPVRQEVVRLRNCRTWIVDRVWPSWHLVNLA